MLSDEGPMLETLDYTIRIGSIPTFLYFDLYLYSAYAAHFVYFALIKASLDETDSLMRIVLISVPYKFFSISFVFMA